MNDIYSQEFIYHYKNQPYKKSLTNFNHEGKDINSSCGDEIEVKILTNKEGKIMDIGYKADGCILSAGAMSVVSDYLIDKNIGEIDKLSKDNILQLIGFEVTPSREKCIIVGLNALRNAKGE